MRHKIVCQEKSENGNERHLQQYRLERRNLFLPVLSAHRNETGDNSASDIEQRQFFGRKPKFIGRQFWRRSFRRRRFNKSVVKCNQLNNSI